MHSREFADLEVATKERISLPDCYRMSWNHIHLMSYEEMWTKVGKSKGGDDHVQREGREAVGRLQREFEAGASIDTEWFCAVYRKTGGSGRG